MRTFASPRPPRRPTERRDRMGPSEATPSARDSRVRIVVLAVAMVVVAIPLHVFAVGRDGPIPPVAIPWWAIAFGFLITEAFSIHIRVNGDSHSASLSEIPLLLGLAAASPGG